MVLENSIEAKGSGNGGGRFFESILASARHILGERMGECTYENFAESKKEANLLSQLAFLFRDVVYLNIGKRNMTGSAGQ